VRPTIFSASLLLAAPEIKTTRTWTGVAGTGRVGLIDHRDAADAIVRVLTDSSACHGAEAWIRVPLAFAQPNRRRWISLR
jgi:hypothetical protein